jgi:hypothetical protein
MKIPEKPLHVFALLVAATAVLLHGNLNAPFCFLDDIRYMRHVAKRSWGEQFVPADGFHYVPVTYLSLKADMLLAGVDRDYFLLATEDEALSLTSPASVPSQEGATENLNAINELKENAVKWSWFPRLMNGIYHTLAGFLLWMFLVRIRAGAGVALFVSFVWTAHPAALESVAWVCERKNVMCALWSFAALLAWTLARENRWRWPLVSLLFTLAISSKVSAISIVPVLCALEFFDPLYREFDWRKPAGWLKSAVRLSGVMAVAFVGVYSTVYIIKGDIVRPPGGSSWTGLLTDSEIFARYTFNALMPLKLSFFYGVDPILSLADLRFWKFLLPLGAFWLALFHFTGRSERYWTAFGFVWFFGALGPNANIVASAFPMQDRYTYLPMPGLLIAVAFAAKGFFAKVDAARWLPAAGMSYAVFILTLCGLRSGLFSENGKLIEHAATLEPRSRLANVMLVLHRVTEIKKLGSVPADPRARKHAEDIIKYSYIAESCYDDPPFLNNSGLRLERFRALKLLGREQESLEALRPGLKPASAFMISPEAQQSEGAQAKMLRFLDRRATAEAWRISGETLLRFSSDSLRSTDQQLDCARQALEYSKELLAFFPHGQSIFQVEAARAQLLRGKALLRISELQRAVGQRLDAESNRSAGVNILQQVDKRSAAGAEAEKLLKELRPLQ